MAITQAQNNGIDIAIITGRTSNIVERRAKELGIKYIYQGTHSKVDALKCILNLLNISLDEVMYIGDDINDIDIMKKVKYTACPRDAVQEVKNIANVISLKDGGNGAVREIIEMVLREQGKWTSIIEKYNGFCQ